MEQEIIFKRIMEGIERISPTPPGLPNFLVEQSFVWKTEPNRIEVVKNQWLLHPSVLVGIDHVKKLLIENTKQFTRGFSANNALLWGSRGMGKSSLIKAVHLIFKTENLKLIEIKREDLNTLDILIECIRNVKCQFIIFCDDLSFGTDELEYKSLKALLDGGLESRPQNILFYATSNRRHLVARDMIENESSTAVHASEAIEEKVSLSDRFGLWLGFHRCSQEEYFDMVKAYSAIAGLQLDEEHLLNQALEWQQTRGSRSGRVAWQFISDLAGKNEINILKKLK